MTDWRVKLFELVIAYREAQTQAAAAWTAYSNVLKAGGWSAPPVGHPGVAAALEALDVAGARRAAAAEALLQHAGDS